MALREFRHLQCEAVVWPPPSIFCFLGHFVAHGHMYESIKHAANPIIGRVREIQSFAPHGCAVGGQARGANMSGHGNALGLDAFQPGA